MMTHRPALAFLALASLLWPRFLFATQISIQWPDGAGIYSLNGATSNRPSKAASMTSAKAKRISLVGTGFNVSFTVNGKVELPYDFAAMGVGVRFDPKTNTFSFAAFDVHVEAKDFSGGIGIDSPPTPAKTSFKLIPGRHTLIYGRNRIGFDLDGDGYVTLRDDIKGLTSRGSIITLQGPLGPRDPRRLPTHSR